MPYKSEILKHLDKVDPIAQEIGAVNTVLNKSNELIGYNTDFNGALSALKKLNVNNKTSVKLFGYWRNGQSFYGSFKRS